ncbi:hypothetical protein [Motilimonas eburnea]|uniref:hypothetical protein n=1 Tax=Motilimonas eburnea TaxID=1737488 RepID=UPI001E45659F|nr:hypothetical protein [Motilimonas eburnea]MCE2571748.1 hypothetical protein [Motilimonas eburnea]
MELLAANQVAPQMSQNESDKTNLKVLIVAMAVMAIFLVSNAIAGQDSTGFDPLWDMVQTWAVGSPAKLIAVISLMSAFFFSILKPNFMMAIGSLLFCAIMGQAEDVIAAFGLTATIF